MPRASATDHRAPFLLVAATSSMRQAPRAAAGRGLCDPVGRCDDLPGVPGSFPLILIYTKISHSYYLSGNWAGRIIARDISNFPVGSNSAILTVIGVRKSGSRFMVVRMDWPGRGVMRLVRGRCSAGYGLLPLPA